MVTSARMRADDFAFAKDSAPLVTSPHGDLDPLTSLPIRSAERRRWAADLTGPALAGLVLHGAGGIGKSTLASQIVARVGHLEPERVTVVIRGQVSVDAVLGGVAAALRRHPAVARPNQCGRRTAPTCRGLTGWPCCANWSSARCRSCWSWTTSMTTCRPFPVAGRSAILPWPN